MDRDWSDNQPIYRQLRDLIVAMILDGMLKEGDALPIVRNVATEFRVNPLTVLKSYQKLVDEGLVESRRGRGMFVNPGARKLLLKAEREKVSRRRMAESLRDDCAARPERGRTAAGLTTENAREEPAGAGGHRTEIVRGGAEPWHA